MPGHVYIVDDEAMVRRFLKKALDHAGFSAQAFESGNQFLEKLAELEPGVVLLDIRMPGMDGLQVLDAMGPKTRIHLVLMLSSHGDVSTAVQAIRSGAIDFIEKPFSVPPLLDRVDNLQRQIEAQGKARILYAEAEARIGLLSEREKEVGAELSAGLSNKEIAKKLGLSPRTVEAHRARLMKKLDVTSAADIVRLFLSVEADFKQ